MNDRCCDWWLRVDRDTESIEGVRVELVLVIVQLDLDDKDRVRVKDGEIRIGVKRMNGGRGCDSIGGGLRWVGESGNRRVYAIFQIRSEIMTRKRFPGYKAVGMGSSDVLR